MSVDSLAMIRRAWKDGAGAVAPQVPGLVDLLEGRLAEAAKSGTVDEAALVAIVDAATQLAANSGAVEVAPALSKRLRRHVYEFLLSLDAVRQDAPSGAQAVETASSPGEGPGPLIGAEEVAAMARGQASGSAPRARSEAPPAPEAAAQGPDSPLRYGFHIGDPDDLGVGVRPPLGPSRSAGSGPGTGLPPAPDPHRPSANGGVPTRSTTFGDPSSWPHPVAPTQRTAPQRPDVAPPRGGAADRGQDPEPRPPSREREWSWPQGGTPTDLNGHSAVAEPRPDQDEWPASDRWADLGPDIEAGLETPAPAAPPAEPGGGARPGGLQLHLSGHQDPSESWRPAPEPEPDLTELRASVEERLRRKKCDDAAALLQQAAQELGGQAVAELALDAGDRCRALGKRNAALNCYLAASRADPVYEAPLARLADICIDDQDIDLAVSYLERIARLTRIRGDQRGALRIYWKIATIAPYRDDVLEMLMRAQSTGRID
jgi:hypothetical protein